MALRIAPAVTVWATAALAAAVREVVVAASAVEVSTEPVRAQAVVADRPAWEGAVAAALGAAAAVEVVASVAEVVVAAAVVAVVAVAEGGNEQ